MELTKEEEATLKTMVEEKVKEQQREAVDRVFQDAVAEAKLDAKVLIQQARKVRDDALKELGIED